MTSSFWGLVVEPNKLYSQTVPLAFKISMASLGPEEGEATAVASDENSQPVAQSANSAAFDGKKESTTAERVTVMIRIDDQEDYALCSLRPDKLEQQPLDLVFTENENIALMVIGKRAVHLTGYYLPEGVHEHGDDSCDEDYDSEDDSDFSCDDEEDEEIDSEDAGMDYDSEDFNSEEDDERVKEVVSEDEALMKQECADSTKEESRAEMQKAGNKRGAKEAREEAGKKAKVQKEKPESAAVAAKAFEKKPESAKKQPQDKPEAKPEGKKEKRQEDKQEAKKDASAKQPKSQPASPVPKQDQGKSEAKEAALEKKTLPNGLVIEDLKIGEGIKAQQGRRVGITYKGALTSGKVFDTNRGKALLHFTLGKGEVIKGLEQGMVGMGLGGERRITVPAALGYGPKGAPPSIPGNSTLVFDITLEKVANGGK